MAVVEIPAMGYGTWKISKSVASIAVYEAIKFAGVSFANIDFNDKLYSEICT
jgi:hypothetical protein